MDIYLSSLAGVLKPLNKFIIRAASEGFKNIEILDEWKHRLSSNERIRELKELRDSYSLQYLVHAPFDGINISTPQLYLRECSLKLIKKSMESAHKVESRIVVIHSGFKSPLDYYKPRTSWNIFLNVLRFVNKVAGSLDVYVGVENLPKYSFALISSHKDAVSLLEHMQSLDRIGLTFDVGHSNTIDGSEVEAFLDHLGNHIIHVHLHDNNGEIDDHLPIGFGSIRWEAFTNKVSRLKLIGGMTLEVLSLDAARESLKTLSRMLNTK
ncbi:MAG: sugar phosphate isomerase/epimerase [Candidatus Nezhaarchaeota archaeon]|nr:sugar phosphate isomerase/epimerase [Candidatus Nezhaarchaeota archaeon]MCX8142072.1 sugar phosphate isomerase/epimerase [Candidatus Nezhaarchaeota archaeon]MDW8050147.1 sugar phosphate isomerase/epimerase family protein [Nitrososphaerota archaeon]